jgi:membrane fusion protein (multidrug efflux system)
MSFARQIALLVVLAALVAGGYVGWREFAASEAGAQQDQARPDGTRGGPAVETAPATFRELETAVDAVGSTRARRAVEITPLAAGRVTEVTFFAGKEVRQGDILLRLDNDIQRADLIEAEARLTEANSALQRARSLKKTSAVSDAAVDKLIAALATAQAEHERAARRLRDRTVTAPFAGIVGFAQVELGARVEEGDAVTTLDDLSLVEIEFALPEGLYGRISPGQRIVANATAFPGRTFEGTIETLDSRIDPVSRAFKARAVVANPDLLLPAGMFMHLAVVLDSRRALTVPEEAIVVDGTQAFVFVVARGEGGQPGGLVAGRRDVTIGQRAFGHVEIVDGVGEGDEVITRGVQKARDGSPVRKARPPGSGAPRPREAAG